MSKETTERRKQRNISRKSALRDRADHAVSGNCLKNRNKRYRAQLWRDADKKTRGPSPTERGMVQFHSNASPFHIFQHENHLPQLDKHHVQEVEAEIRRKEAARAEAERAREMKEQRQS